MLQLFLQPVLQTCLQQILTAAWSCSKKLISYNLDAKKFNSCCKTAIRIFKGIRYKKNIVQRQARKRNKLARIPRKAGDKVTFQAGGKRSELLEVIRNSRVQDTRYSNKPFLDRFSKTNIMTASMFFIYNTDTFVGSQERYRHWGLATAS